MIFHAKHRHRIAKAYPECHRVRNAKVWHIAGPEGTKVCVEADFATPVHLLRLPVKFRQGELRCSLRMATTPKVGHQVVSELFIGPCGRQACCSARSDRPLEAQTLGQIHTCASRERTTPFLSIVCLSYWTRS